MTEFKEDIIRLGAEGLSYREIEKILGCRRSTIAYHLGKNVKEKTQNRSKTQRAAITKWLQEYKETAGCLDCKQSFPHYVLDFDHREGIKNGSPGQIWRGRGKQAAVAELEKCDVVCSNCHKIRTWNRNPW
jgi:hypothetical protein